MKSSLILYLQVNSVQVVTSRYTIQILLTSQAASCLNASTSAFKLLVTPKWLHLQKSAIDFSWESGRPGCKSRVHVPLCSALEVVEIMKKPFIVAVLSNSETVNYLSWNLWERCNTSVVRCSRYVVCYSRNVSVPVGKLPRNWICLDLLGHVHNLFLHVTT